MMNRRPLTRWTGADFPVNCRHLNCLVGKAPNKLRIKWVLMMDHRSHLWVQMPCLSLAWKPSIWTQVWTIIWPFAKHSFVVAPSKVHIICIHPRSILSASQVPSPQQVSNRIVSLYIFHVFKMKTTLIFIYAAVVSAGSLKDVKHVVLFMQENRAFDHVI